MLFIAQVSDCGWKIIKFFPAKALMPLRVNILLYLPHQSSIIMLLKI